MKKINWILILSSLIVVMVVSSFIIGCEPDLEEDVEPEMITVDPDRTTIRWNTTEVGSYGYSVASMMVDFLNRELPEEYEVIIDPYPDTSTAMKETMEGNGDISYTADLGMRLLWDREDLYEDLDPAKGDLVHTFYAYPMETFLTVHEDNTDNYNSYEDFSGEPVFFSPSGYMNWINMERIFETLNYNFNHKEIDTEMTAQALEDGTIEGAASYTTAGQTLPEWWEDTQLITDITVVNPTEDELDKLDDAGLSITSIDPEVFDAQDNVGVDEIYGIPILFGYNMRADASIDLVYTMLYIYYENRDQLAKLDPGFKPLSENFVEMQVQGIENSPDIPVHPGLAHFLRDHDAWNEDWQTAY